MQAYLFSKTKLCPVLNMSQVGTPENVIGGKTPTTAEGWWFEQEKALTCHFSWVFLPSIGIFTGGTKTKHE